MLAPVGHGGGLDRLASVSRRGSTSRSAQRSTRRASPGPAEVGPTASLLVLGHRAARLLDEHLAALDVGAGEAVLLLALRRGPLTMSGVMSALHIKASTATSLVNRLESAGLVERSPNPDDRRSLLVRSTDVGVARAAAAADVFAQFDGAIERAAGADALGHLAVALDETSAAAE